MAALLPPLRMAVRRAGGGVRQFPGTEGGTRALVAPMPRFFLHICNGNGFTEDQEGQDLPDLAAARDAAIRGLRDIMASEMREGEMNLGSFIEIENEGKKLLMTVATEDAINVTRERGNGREGRA